MREIKFRAWRNTGIQKMISWDQLMEAQFNCISQVFDSGCYTLMQYTELKDKYGFEIYEGDIVKYQDNVVINGSREHLSKVEYLTEFGGYCIKMACIGYGTINKAQVKALNVKVIGNIYENPELLKGEE